jgi:hypothetical protein
VNRGGTDLALNESSWPEDRLPASEKAFKYRALDYVLDATQHLSNDDESKTMTKAQNLRKLWSTRAQLRKWLERELTAVDSHSMRHNGNRARDEDSL